MASNIDPSALVNIPCPACNEKTPVSVGEIERSPRLRCEACGSMFAVNAAKIMDKIRAVQQQAEFDRRRRGV